MAEAASRDVLTISGLTGNGTLRLNLAIDGTYSLGDSGNILGSPSWGYQLLTGPSQIDCGLAAGVCQVQATGQLQYNTGGGPFPALASGVVLESAVIDLPINNGTLILTQRFLTTLARSGTFNMLSTARVGGAQILDAGGSPLSGVTVLSANGYDYFAPASAVPEPASATLALVALACLAWRRRSLR